MIYSVKSYMAAEYSVENYKLVANEKISKDIEIIMRHFNFDLRQATHFKTFNVCDKKIKFDKYLIATKCLFSVKEIRDCLDKNNGDVINSIAELETLLGSRKTHSTST
jgi:hypothetical protein